MWPFKNKEHNDCIGHNYDEYKKNWKDSHVEIINPLTREINGRVLSIEPVEIKKCQREGCNKQKKRRKDKYIIPLSCLSELNNFNYEKAGFMEEAERIYDEIENNELDKNEFRLRILDIIEE